MLAWLVGARAGQSNLPRMAAGFQPCCRRTPYRTHKEAQNPAVPACHCSWAAESIGRSWGGTGHEGGHLSRASRLARSGGPSRRRYVPARGLRSAPAVAHGCWFWPERRPKTRRPETLVVLGVGEQRGPQAYLRACCAWPRACCARANLQPPHRHRVWLLKLISWLSRT